MGQYYYPVNITKKQYIHPHKFGDGLKLMEFGCSGQGTMLGLAVLLADGNGQGGGDLMSERGETSPIVGSWAGDQIVIAGDYAENHKFMSKSEILDFDDHVNLHHAAQEKYTDVSEDVLLALLQDKWILKDFREDYTENKMRGNLRETIDGNRKLKALFKGCKKAKDVKVNNEKSLRPDFVVVEK